jgi:hypothetical protein
LCLSLLKKLGEEEFKWLGQDKPSWPSEIA